MKPRKEMRRWLGDTAAQAATFGAIEETMRRLQSLPFMTRLRSELDDTPGDDAEAALAAVARALGEGERLEEALACLVEAAAADPFVRPALRSIHGEVNTGIVLFEHRRVTLVLACVPAEALAAKRARRAGPASIVFTGQQSLYKILRSGGATFSFWEAPPISAEFSAPQSGTCRLAERRPVRDGELLRLDGRCRTFVVDHAARDIVYLHATTASGAAPLAVEYDDRTMRFAGASSTDEAGSRAQLMLSLLRTMERSDALPVFLDMLRHRHFYARWQAMRELLALDAGAALPHLRDMAERDVHPEVRAAAAATLAACFPQAAAVAPTAELELS